eukprot:s3307_g12.t1
MASDDGQFSLLRQELSTVGIDGILLAVLLLEVVPLRLLQSLQTTFCPCSAGFALLWLLEFRVSPIHPFVLVGEQPDSQLMVYDQIL